MFCQCYLMLKYFTYLTKKKINLKLKGHLLAFSGAFNHISWSLDKLHTRLYNLEYI